MTKLSKTSKFIALIMCLIVIGSLLCLFWKKQLNPIKQVNTPTITTTPTDTYGMSKYTDSIYGFSFWYPRTQKVTSVAMQDDTIFPGGTAEENLQIGLMGGTSIYVVNSPSSTITDEPNGHASPIAQTKYSYDNLSKQWMVSSPEGTDTGEQATSPKPANISQTTMSGLFMLPSGRRFDTKIIPLSTTQFLVVSDGGGSSFTSQLAQTISLTNAPIDPTVQSNILQAEANAYNQK